KPAAIEERPRHWQGWLSPAAPSRVLGIPRAAPAATRAKARQDARQIARKVPVLERRQAAGLQMRTVPSGSAIAPSLVRAMLKLHVSTTNPNCRPFALDLGPHVQHPPEPHCARRDDRPPSPVLGCRRDFGAPPATRSAAAFPRLRLVCPPARGRG